MLKTILLLLALLFLTEAWPMFPLPPIRNVAKMELKTTKISVPIVESQQTEIPIDLTIFDYN